MKRLTIRTNEASISFDCESVGDIVRRLAAIEDILGDEYELDAVARVVRCKNCRYYQTAKVNEKGFLICPASGMEITETDYCSYGALMDGKEDEHEAN